MRLPVAIVLLAAAGLLSGCRSGYTSLQEEHARKIEWGRPFYESGKGTPAEFASNRRGQLNREGAILRGEISGDYADAVRKLAACYEDAAIGFAWKEPRADVAVPYLPQAPMIDGAIDPAEWEGALRFDGEFRLNCPGRTPGEPSEWRIGWRDGFLYAAARFRDRDLRVSDGKALGGKSKMFEMDSFEFFLRPRTDQFIYYEFIVNPRGNLWGLMHVNNPWGGSMTLANALEVGARAAARPDAEGFSVELALPLTEFHGVWCRRPPRAGDAFEFIMVRTNRDGEEYSKNSPVPFLYDGHNIFGYARAVLARPELKKTEMRSE